MSTYHFEEILSLLRSSQNRNSSNEDNIHNIYNVNYINNLEINNSTPDYGHSSNITRAPLTRIPPTRVRNRESLVNSDTQSFSREERSGRLFNGLDLPQNSYKLILAICMNLIFMYLLFKIIKLFLNK